MSDDKKRMMSITITVTECTAGQADAVLHMVTTILEATADITNAPTMLTCAPASAPEHIREAATRVIHPRSKSCHCAQCELKRAEGTKGEPVYMPFDVAMTSEGEPNYSSLDDLIPPPSTKPTAEARVNVKPTKRGQIS